MADRIVVLDAGLVQQIGTPMELYNKPANRFVAGFIGSPRMNFFEGAVAARYGAHSIGVRPEHLRLSEAPDSMKATVALVERLGNSTILYARLEDSTSVTASFEGQHEFELGAAIALAPLADAVHRFAEDGGAVRGVA